MEDKSRFTLEEWDAPIYIGAEELRHALVHMQLENKVIHGFRLLDYSAVQLPEWDKTEEEVMIPAFAALSSPLIILFTDGTRLELFMQDQSVFRLSVKRIPIEAIKEEVTANSLDRLFARTIGTSIVFIEVQVTEDFPEIATEYAEQFKKQTEYIDSVLFCLDSGDALELYSWGKNGEVDLLDENGEITMIGMNEFLDK
ncbi:MAG: hypothetical protein IJ100_10440 [Lachnospiraceae bacterium]|nr:hypothetical protein [Lachnospiraceae bacterium]